MNERAPVTDWARDFDHLDPRWAQDRHWIWRALRQTCPVAHTDRCDGVYFPSRYEDVRAVAYDTEHFSSRRVSIREGKPVLPPSPPVTADPPAHRDDRKILIAPFTPQSVAKLEPKTRAICRELLERLSDRKECDAAVDYAQEIPSSVTAYLLGTSEHEGPRFRKWARDFLEQGAADPAVTHRVLAEVDTFFAKEISTRKAAPGDDLISYLLEAKANGKALSDEHIRATTRLLFFAGIDTTCRMIDARLRHLATPPNDRNPPVPTPHLLPTPPQ